MRDEAEFEAYEDCGTYGPAACREIERSLPGIDLNTTVIDYPNLAAEPNKVPLRAALAIDAGRPLELPPQDGVAYVAFVDAASGASDRADAYTVAIGHHENGKFIVDVVRGVTGTYDPYAVTRQFADLLKQYAVRTVTGDNYGAKWVSQYWTETGFAYERSPWTRSEIYLESMALFARRVVRLPDHARMLRELRLLERSTAAGGKDAVNHGRGGHDDFANVACGVLRLLDARRAADADVPLSMPWAISKNAGPIGGGEAPAPAAPAGREHVPVNPPGYTPNPWTSPFAGGGGGINSPNFSMRDKWSVNW
jgi:hypothetical protein